MQDQNSQYKPRNLAQEITDLVCPHCGADVPSDLYIPETSLANCQTCNKMFTVFVEKSSTVNHSSSKPVGKTNYSSGYLIAFVLLLIALVMLWMLKNR